MKVKVILILVLMLFVCGCDNIRNTSLDTVISSISQNTKKKANVINSGYKYYLPLGLSVKQSNLFNDIITSKDYTFYLYVDAISYYNKVEFEYKENNEAFYSKKLEINDKFGYVEINLQKNNQYLIEIMFNYAKIEVIVDYADVSLATNYAVNILKSIEYNDNVILGYLSDKTLSFQEEEYNIFNTKKSDSNTLELLDEESHIEASKPRDEDLIN